MATVTDTMQSTGSVVHQAKFIDVKGTRTRYYELGSGEPMILIHGATFPGRAAPILGPSIWKGCPRSSMSSPPTGWATA